MDWMWVGLGQGSTWKARRIAIMSAFIVFVYLNVPRVMKDWGAMKTRDGDGKKVSVDPSLREAPPVKHPVPRPCRPSFFA